jgi:hypothetical protein
MSFLSRHPQYLRIEQLTALEIGNPTADQLADYATLYQLNVRPYTRYISNGTSLVLAGEGGTAGVDVITAQTMIDSSIASNNNSIFPVLNQLENKTGVLPATKVGPVSFGGTSYSNVQLAISALYALIQPGGATAPVPNAAPSVAFPGGTGDVGETATITVGTYTVLTPTSTQWNVTVNGVVVMTTSSTTFTIPSSAGVSPRALSVTELYSWSGGINIVGKTSATYTINVPPAVPVIITAASISGTAQVGQTLTGSVGSWTNTPTNYVKQFYSGGIAISGASASSGVTTLSYVTTSTDAGATITFGATASNATGTGIESISGSLVIAGGIAPSWSSVDAIQPGWVNGTFQVGILMTADFGLAANNPGPALYDYQILRDGIAVSGSAGSNVSGFTYTPVLADQDHELSFSLTAKNAAGSATTTCASVTIDASTGGSGGTASFVGYNKIGTTSVASATIAPPSSIANLDFALLVQSNNGPQNWNAPTGTWTQDGITLSLTTNGERAEVWKRVLSGSEPATYTISPAVPEIFGAIVCAWRGPTSVVARNSSTNDTANASPISVQFLTVTPTAANQTVVLIAVLDHSVTTATAWTPPSGFTIRAEEDFTGIGSEWATIVVMDKVWPDTSATGTLTASAAVTTGTAGWLTYTIVLG